jgi:L-seryl-tRNA(Ser) seleniumtransferase
MAIKPPEILNRLPSVSELLDKPPIRALADRWNRTAVAGSVRSFLEEVATDLRRRAADVQLPSLRELAERAASYVAAQQQQFAGATINATGQLWGGGWNTRPISEAALERAVAVGREFTTNSAAGDVLASNCASTICRLTGAQAAVATHSYSGAIWLALSALGSGRELIVARADVGDIGGTDPLPKLAEITNVTLREVGTMNRVAAADYSMAVSPNTAAILRLSADEYQVVGATGAANLAELVALARERKITLIDAMGTAPIVDPPMAVSWPVLSVRSAIAEGVELVVVRGDGLIGGPACGIMVGAQDIMERIAHHPLFSSFRLNAARLAALAATLESYEGGERSAESLPVWQLLATPIENLRNRAERIAPQLAQAPDVESATVIEVRSPISAALPIEHGYLSYGIALTARDGKISELDARLRSTPLPVIGRVERDRLVLDLRTVLPRQDRALVEAIAGAPQPRPS